jgi:hypothetical protein
MPAHLAAARDEQAAQRLRDRARAAARHRHADLLGEPAEEQTERATAGVVGYEVGVEDAAGQPDAGVLPAEEALADRPRRAGRDLHELEEPLGRARESGAAEKAGRIGERVEQEVEKGAAAP